MNKFENLLFKKVSLWIVLFCILNLLLIFFVLNWLSVSGRVSFMKEIGNLPHNIKRIITGVNSDLIIEDRFKDQIGGFTFGENPNDEELSGYLLLPRYIENRSVVELIDIANNKILHTWKPEINELIFDSKIDPNLTNLKRDRNQNRFMMSHPLMLNDGSLIFMHDSPLIKIDFCGKPVWKLDEYFHHSINLDLDENIWSLGRNYPSSINNDSKHLMDDTLMKVSKNGKLIYKKSIIKLLIENKLESLFLSYSGYDPIHVNDVEVAKKDGYLWKKDDVFLSIRNLSLIIIYRPSTNKILWYSQGPWVHQHDIDIIDENTISVFNNNLNISKSNVNGSNDVTFYNFSKNEYSTPYRQAMKKFNVKTLGGGLSSVLSNNDLFIEETNYGRILRINKNSKLIWSYLNKDSDGKLRGLGFARFLEKKKYSKTIEILKQKKCE